MDRADVLREIFKGIDESKQKIVSPLIDEAVFLEKQMAELKKYPFIKFHPKNPDLQKITAAGKQYREFLQTYTNIIDKLCRVYGSEENENSKSELSKFYDLASDFMKGLEVR